MKRFILFLFILFLPCLARAQQGFDCTAVGTCVASTVSPSQGGATFVITANASANTIQFEASADGGITWVALNVTPSNSTTAVTSATTTGVWQANVAGFTNLRMRMSTLVSGLTTVRINQSTASARAGGGGGASSANVIDPTASPYNVVVGHWIIDATLGIGTNIIDCTFSNDCNFTTAQNGWQCWATNMTSDLSGISSTIILPQGTLTVTDAQHATCSGGNATSSSTHVAVFAWGPKMDTQLSLAETAMYSQCGQGMLLPGNGMIFVAKAHFNTDKPGCYFGGISESFTLIGRGNLVSGFVPTPDFDPTTCTGGIGSSACFGATPGLTVDGLSVWGTGVATPTNSAGFNGKTLWDSNGGTSLGNSSVSNFRMMDWAGVVNINTIGFSIDHVSSGIAQNVFIDGAGSINCQINPGAGVGSMAQLIGDVCGNASASALTISGTTTSHGGIYGVNTGAGTAVNGVIVTSATFDSFGDQFPYVTHTGQAQVACVTSATCKFHAGEFNNTTASTSFNIITSGASTVYLENTTAIESGTTSVSLETFSASDKIISLGGNKISGTGSAVVLAGSSSFTPNPTDVYTGTMVKPTLTGTGACATFSTQTGDPLSGTFVCTGTTGAATITITPGITSGTGWNCVATNDITTVADLLHENSSSTAACVLGSALITQNDVINFSLVQQH